MNLMDYLFGEDEADLYNQTETLDDTVHKMPWQPEEAYPPARIQGEPQVIDGLFDGIDIEQQKMFMRLLQNRQLRGIPDEPILDDRLNYAKTPNNPVLDTYTWG